MFLLVELHHLDSVFVHLALDLAHLLKVLVVFHELVQVLNSFPHIFRRHLRVFVEIQLDPPFLDQDGDVVIVSTDVLDDLVLVFFVDFEQKGEVVGALIVHDDQILLQRIVDFVVGEVEGLGSTLDTFFDLLVVVDVRVGHLGESRLLEIVEAFLALIKAQVEELEAHLSQSFISISLFSLLNDVIDRRLGMTVKDLVNLFFLGLSLFVLEIGLSLLSAFVVLLQTGHNLLQNVN